MTFDLVRRGDSIKSNIINFPKSKNENISKTDNIEQFTDLVENIIEQNMQSASNEISSKDITDLYKKPLIVSNIMKKIDNSKSSLYIKDRNKLIINMFIGGMNATDIAELKKEEINNLKVDEKYKRKLQEFVSKHFNQKKQEFIILTKNQKDRLKPSSINKIKRNIMKENGLY